MHRWMDVYELYVCVWHACLSYNILSETERGCSWQHIMVMSSQPPYTPNPFLASAKTDLKDQGLGFIRSFRIRAATSFRLYGSPCCKSKGV